MSAPSKKGLSEKSCGAPFASSAGTPSVESDWVEWEAETARRKRKETGRDILCPIAIDESWKTCDWEAPLRRQIEKYFVMNFQGWEDCNTFKKDFERLTQGLAENYAAIGRPREEA